MNKFIIFPCFIIVFSLHLLLFSYFRNTEIIKSPSNNNDLVQIQLNKAYEKTKVKDKPKKETTKETQKPIQKKEPIKEKVIDENLKDIEKLKTKKENLKESESKISENQNNEQKIKEQKFIDSYASRLREEINKNKKYPTMSKKLKEEGKVIVSFKVLKNGQFENISILLSSNKERLDKAALNALYDTKEFEAFDKSIKKEFLEFNLPLEFFIIN
uniref:energy transducer TonB n=1 Tax=Aliarcobacter sp. TaxID=2321116 RepID=UPI0040487789